MAPALQLLHNLPVQSESLFVPGRRPGARETQAAWRQVPHGFAVGTPKGLKSAPHHRDFRPGKEGDN